jgi:hypothetical protein
MTLPRRLAAILAADVVGALRLGGLRWRYGDRAFNFLGVLEARTRRRLRPQPRGPKPAGAEGAGAS